MKKLLVSVLASVAMLSLVSCGSSTVIPAPDSKLDSLLTFDEANLRLNDWRSKIAGLESRDSMLAADNKALEEKLEAEKNAAKKCADDIYALVHANEAQVNDYKENLGRLTGQISELKSLDDEHFEARKNDVYDLAKTWNGLRTNQISVLPEFFDRMVQARADIVSLMDRKVVKKSKSYTVRSWEQYHDCLWNIAGQSDIYGDPFQWVKLWQGNSNIIRNPDIIREGMELTVPPPGPKTTEEQKAERMYWRKKKANQEAAMKLPAANSNVAAPSSTPAPAPAAPAKKMDEKGEKKSN